MPKVTFSPSGKEVEIEPGGLILDAAAKADVHINASCGGEGTCGKCKVRVEGKKVESRSTARLSEAEIAKGYVLACQARVFSDLRVQVPLESELLSKDRSRIKTLTSSVSTWNEQLADLELDPPVTKTYMELTPPTLEDSVSDLTRVTRHLRKAMDVHDVVIDLETVKELSATLREADWRVTGVVVRARDHVHLIGLEPGDTTRTNYALAVDIGTTTCSAQIIDVPGRRILAEATEYNGQVSYGEDVISRMVYAKKPRGLALLQKKVVRTIDQLIETLAVRANIAAHEINYAVMAGNTVMTHLILGVSTDRIREAPYTPVFRFAPEVTSDEIGFKELSSVPVFFLPSVASYLGGDITSGVAASGLLTHDGLILYIDIGTNGEIVLGNNEWLVGCSCSAGPAFEGAGVKDGIRSIDGAIERVSVEPDTFETVFSTIGGQRPIGICGSGLIDTVAELFRAGVVDKRGKFHIDLDTDRVRRGEYGWEFVIARKPTTAAGRDIVITEVDIDNLMRAKAAVFAGIITLVASVGAEMEDISEVFIAGSFGNYIKIEEAIGIGLLPDLPIEKFKFVGNCSLLGAAKTAVSRHIMDKAGAVTRSLSYMELSADNTFMDKYMSALFLPHTDESLFPSVKGDRAP